ncbi:hypothetical protein PG994_003548 [Apiospora phragmitis]|uniref:REJ domain-containing protein n=1 Tax=Apiospora phragmitis TaxID=2905665 RepID=A0ABR1VYF1_9PEZI
MEASTNQSPGSRQQPPQRTAGMATRGFQSSRPFQPQPLSINTDAEPRPSSMHSVSSSISSSSPTASTFSSSLTSPTSLLSPTSSIDSTSSIRSTSITSARTNTTTHIHKSLDGSLLMNSSYMSPATPVGEGFLDPRAPVTVGVARLHVNAQVSKGSELNLHVRGNVDMIYLREENRMGVRGGDD